LPDEPLVTIVVVPRESFSAARDSLESVYENSDISFKLVYVDGGSPARIGRYLQKKSKENFFELIRTNHYLSPNTARNIGLKKVTTRYVLFLDNDVIVAPGWLGPLVRCAEETDAWITGPLLCEGAVLHEIIHSLGGVCEISARRINDQMMMQGQRVADAREKLKREKTGLAEFHCMLVRTDVFKKLGPLDSQMINTREHIDFCLSVAQAGGSVYVEPQSVITYISEPRLRLFDIPYYSLRWSDAWELQTLRHFRQKWDLVEDEYFEKRYCQLGDRRRHAIFRPWARQLGFRKANSRVEEFLVRIDKKINRFYTDYYAKKYPEATGLPRI